MSTVEKGFDYADLVRRHIERCLAASYDVILYEREIRALEAIVPEDLADEAYTREVAASSYTTEKYDYEFVGPIRLGSVKEPLMEDINGWSEKEHPIPYITIKDEDTGIEETVIDWSNPHIISPKLIEEEHINWDKRLQANFNLFYRLGFVIRMDS